eukprot:422864-Pelagomonas_calceolata.AAC.2
MQSIWSKWCKSVLLHPCGSEGSNAQSLAIPEALHFDLVVHSSTMSALLTAKGCFDAHQMCHAAGAALRPGGPLPLQGFGWFRQGASAASSSRIALRHSKANLHHLQDSAHVQLGTVLATQLQLASGQCGSVKRPQTNRLRFKCKFLPQACPYVAEIEGKKGEERLTWLALTWQRLKERKERKGSHSLLLRGRDFSILRGLAKRLVLKQAPFHLSALCTTSCD